MIVANEESDDPDRIPLKGYSSSHGDSFCGFNAGEEIATPAVLIPFPWRLLGARTESWFRSNNSRRAGLPGVSSPSGGRRDVDFGLWCPYWNRGLNTSSLLVYSM